MSDEQIRRLQRRLGRMEAKIENLQRRNQQLEKIIRTELDVDVEAALEDGTHVQDDTESDDGIRPP